MSTILHFAEVKYERKNKIGWRGEDKTNAMISHLNIKTNVSEIEDKINQVKILLAEIEKFELKITIEPQKS